MASLTESSVASVPSLKLAQLREELLREQPAVNVQPEAKDETHASGVAAYTQKDVDIVVPESANAYHTPISSPRAPPRLLSSKSAPAIESETMVHPSPSQEAFNTYTRAQSFHGYPGGDTQPMESQVYRDFTASVANPNATTPKKPVLSIQISRDGDTTYDTIALDETLRTCVEGETGYIDLGRYEPISPTAVSTSSHVDELLENPQTQQRAEDNVVRPDMPETPAIAGKKRNSNGEIMASSSTTKKTPGFTQLFGGHEKAQMLTATQLFNHTQARSSPPLDGPRSDPVISRPSPNMHNHFALSSPTFPTSSPVMTLHSRPGTAGEPRESYTSMRESQEKRAARLREERALVRQFGDGGIPEEDEEDDPELMRIAQKRRQKAVNDQAVHEWSTVKASSRPSPRPTSRQNSSPQQPLTIDLVTPAPNKDKIVEFNELEDDLGFSGDEVVTEEEAALELENSDDEWDELGQAVLRSQTNHEGEGVAADLEDVLDEGAMTHAEENVPDATFEDYEAGAKEYTQHQILPTQPSAIADSQPFRGERDRALLPQHPTAPSSVSSFVPGSQYPAKSSQDHPAVTTTSSSRPLPTSTGKRHSNQNVPSSPPIQAPELHAEVSNVTGTSLANEKSIPESDLPDNDDRTGDPLSPTPLNNRLRRESNNVLYSTARTHVSASGASPYKRSLAASPLKVFASQQSKISSQSPRTAAGVRHFADIATAASPPNGSTETDVDVDAIMSDVVTAEDQDFMQVVSTPTDERRSKRRKVVHGGSDSILGKDKRDQSVVSERATDNEEQQQKSPQENEITTNKNVTFATALQDSPSKGNVLPSATPVADDQVSSTPESVKKREQAGASAASQLVSNRKLKTTKVTKRYGKANRRAALTRQNSSSSAPDRNSKSMKVASNLGSRPMVEITHEADEDAVAVEAAAETGTAVNGRILGEQNTEPPERATNSTKQEFAKSCAPNRVFALFKGHVHNYYPATYLGASLDGVNCHIKFDDETTTSIELQHICQLELLVGDVVKVDLQGMRSKTWQITGFGPVARNDEELETTTDVHGRQSVKIIAKSSRDSGANVSTDSNEDVIEAAISTIYLTRTMWPHFADRQVDLASNGTKAQSRIGTPSSGALPHHDNPTSRSGRAIVPADKVTWTRTSNLREDSVSVPELPTASGLFSGMAFAISYGSNEGEKAEVTRLIRSNGGIIFESGFDELFQLPSLDESIPTSPAKKSPRKGAKVTTNSVGLQLKPEYKDLGFVALIADRHSRRAKYFQALALSLPTLSGKWISDSLDTSKNPDTSAALPWSKYLLPAGESKYLGGAIRSRTMSLYHASEARLSTTIKNRDVLLNGDGVLIVAAKKSAWERRKAYAFLTLALGAVSVKRVSDVAEARAFANSEPDKWKWIYVDGSVAEASATIFAKGGAGGKKRKRGEDSVKADKKAMCASDGTLKIVDDEFVIQSLILGALVE